MSVFRNFSSVFKLTAAAFAIAFLYAFLAGSGVSYDYNWDNDYRGAGDFLLALKTASLYSLGVFVLAGLFEIVHNLKLIRDHEKYVIKYGEPPVPKTAEEQRREYEEYRQKREIETLQWHMRAAGMEYQKQADFAANQMMLADKLAEQKRIADEEKTRESARLAAISRRILLLKNGDLIYHQQYGKMRVIKVYRDATVSWQGQKIVASQSSIMVRFGGQNFELAIDDNLISNVVDIVDGQSE